MIKILHRDGFLCPIVICDICQDMIGNVSEGAAVFSCSGDANQKTEVLHAHKGQCHEAAEAKFDNDGWQELAYHLYLLCLNTGMDHKKYLEMEEQNAQFPGWG